MAEFILEQVQAPLAVRRESVTGLLSDTVHLTDDRVKTLCGLNDRLVTTPKSTTATCKKCLFAVDGWARVKREFR